MIFIRDFTKRIISGVAFLRKKINQYIEIWISIVTITYIIIMLFITRRALILHDLNTAILYLSLFAIWLPVVCIIALSITNRGFFIKILKTKIFINQISAAATYLALFYGFLNDIVIFALSPPFNLYLLSVFYGMAAITFFKGFYDLYTERHCLLREYILSKISDIILKMKRHVVIIGLGTLCQMTILELIRRQIPYFSKSPKKGVFNRILNRLISFKNPIETTIYISPQEKRKILTKVLIVDEKSKDVTSIGRHGVLDMIGYAEVGDSEHCAPVLIGNMDTETIKYRSNISTAKFVILTADSFQTGLYLARLIEETDKIKGIIRATSASQIELLYKYAEEAIQSQRLHIFYPQQFLGMRLAAKAKLLYAGDKI